MIGYNLDEVNEGPLRNAVIELWIEEAPQLTKPRLIAAIKQSFPLLSRFNLESLTPPPPKPPLFKNFLGLSQSFLSFLPPREDGINRLSWYRSLHS